MPDIPTPGRLVELEYASISDRKMRGQLRNPGEIEKTVSTPSACIRLKLLLSRVRINMRGTLRTLGISSMLTSA